MLMRDGKRELLQYMLLNRRLITPENFSKEQEANTMNFSSEYVHVRKKPDKKI
jgi:hypothetical protein